AVFGCFHKHHHAHGRISLLPHLAKGRAKVVAPDKSRREFCGVGTASWRPLAGFACSVALSLDRVAGAHSRTCVRSVALSFSKLAVLAKKNWRARQDSNL